MFSFIAPLFLSMIVSQAASAQHDSSRRFAGPEQHGAAPPSPSGHSRYDGLEKRLIKALSDQQIDDIKSGRGMSLALPAELNGYPGPAHVLELSEQLGLSAGQKLRVTELHKSMQAEAVQIGARLIEQEIALDHLFAHNTASTEAVRDTTAAISITQGRLRNAHLKYHLAMAEVLRPEQRDTYAMLRGYKPK